MRYGITGVFGTREFGKTTYMAKYLMQQVNSGKYYDQAFCNIEIDHPKIKKITYAELVNLKLPAPNGVPRAIVGLDQIHKYLYSRQSNSKRNIGMAEVIVEMRQHGFDLIYTTWMRSSVDKTLRPFTDLIVIAQHKGPPFDYRIIDKQRGELGTYRITVEMAQEVFKKFDTSELIQDATIPR